MYSLSDGPAGLIVFASAVVLALIGRELLPNHPVSRRIGHAFYLAAVSIAAIACIYWAFAVSLDVGIAVRPWAKAVSGAAAGAAAWQGIQVIRATWKHR